MKQHDRCGALLFLVLAFTMAGGMQASSVAADLTPLTKELLALEDQWTEAFIKHDPAPLASILADEYMGVGNDGRVWTKTRIMERVKEKNFTLHSFTILEPKAQRHGDTAVLYGMAIDKGIEAGKEYSQVLRFQDVWLNRNGRWQCIAGQNAPAEKEMPISTFSSKARELFIQAREKMENYEPIAAAPLFEQAVSVDSNFALAYCYRSQCGGGYQISHANLAKANAHSGKASLGEQLYIQLIQAYFDDDQPAQKKCVDQLVALYPMDKRSRELLGDYLINTQEYKPAINCYEKALEIDKEFAPAYEALAHPNIRLGNLAAAETALKEYIRLRPGRPDPYATYGYLLSKMGRYDESIVQFQKSLELSDQAPWSAAGIGINYLYKGDYGKAREYYQLYFDKSSRVTNKLGALYYTATSYLYEGNLNAARKVFAERRALAKKENQPGVMINAIVLDGLAQTAFGKPSAGLNRLKEAEAMLDQVSLTDKEKESFHTWFDMCYCYTYAENNQLEQLKARAASHKQAIERRNNPSEKDNLIWAQAYIDKTEKNYDAVIAGLSKVQPDPYAYFMMGQAALSKGDKQAAKDYFNKVKNWNEFSFNQAIVWNRVHQELEKLKE